MNRYSLSGGLNWFFTAFPLLWLSFPKQFFTPTSIVVALLTFPFFLSSNHANMPTILFLTNSELGQASVCLAVAHEFLLRPTYTIHIASFASLRVSISQLNLRAISFLPVSSRSARVRPATFHILPGPSMKQALEQRHNFNASKAFKLHGLGFQAACQAYKDVLAKMVAPWSGEEYVAIYAGCVDVIERVGPQLVVVDPLFGPGLDAVRSIGRRFVVLSPNTFREHVAQPKLAGLWKFPMYIFSS